MTIVDTPCIRSPTLYRVAGFVGWLPREEGRESMERIARLETALGDLNWIPPGAQIGAKSELAWCRRKLWDVWDDSPPWDATLRHESSRWSVHRYAQSYHEQIVVLVGVEQAQICAGPDLWVSTAQQRLASVGPAKGQLADSVALPEEEDPGDRPRMLGEILLWTGEWEMPPVSGWTQFAAPLYGEENIILFP